MKLETVQSCPACGSNGSVVLEGCRDHICDVPGSWSFRQCQQCDSLWMDPRPAKDMIPSLYPDNYYFTRGQPLQPLQSPQEFWMKIKFSVKLAILEHVYGYAGLSQKAPFPLGVTLGHFLSFLPWLSRWAGYTVRFLPYQPQGRLLEVGSGNGTFLCLMRELGWETVGIEPDPQAAQVAACMGLKVMQCTVEDAELEPSSYDVVTLSHVLEHLPDSKGVLSKLASCLKPRGILVSISPNPIGLIGRWFRNAWYELDAPRHLVLPSPKGYRSMLENLGFQVNVWTTMPITLAFWMCHGSMGIQRTGRIDGYQGWLLPKIVASSAKILSLTVSNGGEEVVCCAIKD